MTDISNFKNFVLEDERIIKAVEDKIAKQSSFISTIQVPYPSKITKDALDDLAAVLAGTKPMAIIGLHNISLENGQEMLNIMLDMAKKKGLVIATREDGEYIVGKIQNIKLWSSGQLDTGSALGISDEAIQDFAKRMPTYKIRRPEGFQ